MLITVGLSAETLSLLKRQVAALEKIAINSEALAGAVRSIPHAINEQTTTLQAIEGDFQQVIKVLQEIEVNTGPAYAVAFQIALVSKENNMKKGRIVSLVSKAKGAKAGASIAISDSAPQAVAVFGVDAAGVYGASLAPGATISMSAGPGAKGTPGTFVQDATPGVFDFVDPTGATQSGIQSLASGVFTPAAAGSADVNDPFSISFSISGGSGDSGSALFQTQVGVETSEVIGLPTSTTPPTPPPVG